MGVLAAGPGLFEADRAMAVAIGGDAGIGLGERLRVERARHEGRRQFVIAGVFRQWAAEIDAVAVEVDPLLGRPAQPGETMRVDGMDDERGGRGTEPFRPAGEEPVGGGSRSAEALDAMRRRNQDQNVARVARPEPVGLGRQQLALRTDIRVGIGDRRRRTFAGERRDPLAGSRIVGGECRVVVGKEFGDHGRSARCGEACARRLETSSRYPEKYHIA